MARTLRAGFLAGCGRYSGGLGIAVRIVMITLIEEVLNVCFYFWICELNKCYYFVSNNLLSALSALFILFELFEGRFRAIHTIFEGFLALSFITQGKGFLMST